MARAQETEARPNRRRLEVMPPDSRLAIVRKAFIGPLHAMARKVALLSTNQGALPVVLVCDDEPVLRTLVRDALRDASCVVIEACDGKEALRLARSDFHELMHHEPSISTRAICSG